MSNTVPARRPDLDRIDRIECLECLADLEIAARKHHREGTPAAAAAVDALVETYLRFPCCVHLTRLAHSWRDDQSAGSRMSVAPQLSKYASYAQQ